MNSDLKDLLPAITAAIGWLIVVAGWIIVNNQNNKRESRKEFRSLIDSSKKLTIEIADLGVGYRQAPTRAQALAIKYKLDLLELELGRLPGHTEKSTMMARYVEFADALTGGDFESSPAPAAEDAPEVVAIYSTRISLLLELEAEFRRMFKPT